MSKPVSSRSHGAYRVLRFDEVGSTNTVAKAYLSDRTVLTARRQTEGRGRRGRAWLNTEDALLMSIVLRSTLPAERMPLYSLMASVAVRNALGGIARLHVKWPNDVVTAQGRKLCGILSECVVFPNAYVILGIGINLNAEAMPEGLLTPATSLFIESGLMTDADAVLDSVLDELDAVLCMDTGRMLEEYRRCCATIGSRVSVVEGGSTCYGYAEDVDDEGRLIVKFNDGTTRALCAADVSIRRAK